MLLVVLLIVSLRGHGGFDPLHALEDFEVFALYIEFLREAS